MPTTAVVAGAAGAAMAWLTRIRVLRALAEVSALPREHLRVVRDGPEHVSGPIARALLGMVDRTEDPGDEGAK